MIVRLIRVSVKDDAVAAFEAATKLNHVGSLSEPGVLRFDVLRKPDEPGVYLLYEVYASEQAAEEHKQTAHYQEWKETVADMMARPRESETLAVVAPGEERSWRAR